MRILQARILDCVAMSFSRGSSQPRDWTHVSQVSCVGRQVLYPEPPGKPTSALNPITSTLIRAREERQTRRRPCENRGRDYCCAARSQGMAGATRRWKRKEGSSLKASGEPGSVNTFFKKKIFYLFLIGWWLVYNIDLISVIHQHELTIGVHTSPHSWVSLPPPAHSYPFRLLQSPSFSSRNHTANSHWLSIYIH